MSPRCERALRRVRGVSRMFGGDRRRGSIAGGAKAALLAACVVAESRLRQRADPAASRSRLDDQSGKSAGPDAHQSAGHDHSAGGQSAEPPGTRQSGAPTAATSAGTGTSVGPGVTGFDHYNATLNAKLGGPIAPGSTTLEAALALAYFNNPTLNAQRAATRATDENVPTALSGYRPRVTGSSSLTDQYLENLVKNQNSIAGPLRAQRDLIGQEPMSDVSDLRQEPRLDCRHECRIDRHPDAVQRLPDVQSHPAGRRPGVRGARNPALDRADHAAQRRDRLHESAARRRDPRTAAQQRERARGHAAPDARPVQRR